MNFVFWTFALRVALYHLLFLMAISMLSFACFLFQLFKQA